MEPILPAGRSGRNLKFLPQPFRARLTGVYSTDAWESGLFGSSRLLQAAAASELRMHLPAGVTCVMNQPGRCTWPGRCLEDARSLLPWCTNVQDQNCTKAPIHSEDSHCQRAEALLGGSGVSGRDSESPRSWRGPGSHQHQGQMGTDSTFAAAIYSHT